MFVIGTVIAGSILAGVAIQKRKKKKVPLVFHFASHTVPNKAPSSLDKMRDETFLGKYKQKEQKVLRVLQRKHLSTDSNSEISQVKLETDTNLACSLSGLGLTIAGAVVYPPLVFLGLLTLVYPSLWLFKRNIEYIYKDRRISAGLIDLIFFTAAWVTGYYFVMSLVLTLYFSSRKLLLMTEEQGKKNLMSVFGEQPQTVWVLSDGIEIEIPFENVQINDIIVIHAGDAVPIDGVITSGYAMVDQRALTGESQPALKAVGDQVLASTILLSGQIHVAVQKAGQETVAAQIGKILSQTSDFKSSVQSRGERIVDQGAILTLAVSGVALPMLGVTSAMAALCTGFGFQMRLAAPISVLNFLYLASQKGILIKDGRSLELVNEVDTFVFDKTGTLTEDVPTIGKIHSFNGHCENSLLAYAAAAEHKQSHPIARAIQREAGRRNIQVPPITDAQVEMGFGLKVKVGEALIHIGSRRFMEMEKIAVIDDVQKLTQDCHAMGFSLVYIAYQHELCGAIELCPTIRSEAKQIIQELQRRNISTVIISGDHEKPTQKLAQELGIDNYFAETLPQDKARLIEQLQAEGKSVCFVGDGINDSIALKKANVSISMSGASTVATDSAGIVLMDGNLNQLIPLLDIAQNMDANLSTITMLTIVPGVLCIGGVFFFHLGVVGAIMLYNSSLVACISNAMLPMVKHQKNQLSKRVQDGLNRPMVR